MPLCWAIWWCWNITFSSVKWDHRNFSKVPPGQTFYDSIPYLTLYMKKTSSLITPEPQSVSLWKLYSTLPDLFQRNFGKWWTPRVLRNEFNPDLSLWRRPETQTMRKPCSRSLGKLMEEPESQFKGRGLLDYFFSAEKYDWRDVFSKGLIVKKGMEIWVRGWVISLKYHSVLFLLKYIKITRANWVQEFLLMAGHCIKHFT